jgi:hypothetical protein
MSRHLITLSNERDRIMARRYVDEAPPGTRIELRAARRTLPQNDRMWAMLTDIARQKEHAGRRYTPDQWKVLILHALGQEMQTAPSLDHSTFIPLGYSSRELSVSEMGEMIDFMHAWGAEHGIKFGDAE